MRAFRFRARLVLSVVTCLLLASGVTSAAPPPQISSGADLITAYAPEALAHLIIRRVPFEISIGGTEQKIELQSSTPGVLEGSAGDIRLTARYDFVAGYDVLRWTLTLSNPTAKPITSIDIMPLKIPFNIVPDRDQPRVRHITGSYHYDAVYPPRAFRVFEERFMTHDHAKPVEIASGHGASAYDNVPILEFATGPQGHWTGFWVGFEWSSRWFLEATWARNSFTGEPRPEFLVQGNVGLQNFRLEPGESLQLPRIHLGFWTGPQWDSADYSLRHYIRDVIGARFHGKVPVPPVSYDHWFGIYQFFDEKEMMRQADRAAALGVEYFCLDAAWYPVKESFADGLGNWYPDPKKFPHGIEPLSEHVRKLGMGFGLWQMIELATPGTQSVREHPDLYYKGAHLRLDLPAGRAFALSLLRKWVHDWHLTWMRWEFMDPETWTYELDPSGKLNMQAMNGLYEVMDTLERENPDLMIESCSGGATRLDLGFAVRSQTTWLNDHTNNADVVRFLQTGASRVWPAHYLDMAVRVQRNSGDSEVFLHNFISRMVGTLSFNGDIAQWSSEATHKAADWVRIYKSIRARLDEQIRFPLGQPHSDRDWDVAIVGDDGKPPLLFVFRMEGPETIKLRIPKGKWVPVLVCPGAEVRSEGENVVVALPPNSSGIWTLQSPE